MAQHIVTGIDIGTYHVKVVVARVDSQNPQSHPHILGTGFAESHGLRHGYIVNEADITRSIQNAITQAEKSSGLHIKHAYLSMGGIGIDEIHTRGETITSRADSTITQADIDKAIEVCESNIQEKIPNRKILHAIPLSYTVDHERVHGRPHNLKGTKLEVDVLFVTAFEQHLNDLVSAVENLGVRVIDIMAAPMAASLVLLNKTQKRAGCVLANIGSETLSIAVYEHDIPVSIKVFSLGSNDITNDIALGLKISIEDAEKLKRGGIITTPYSKKRLDEIVAARLSDMFELIEAHLRKIKRDGLLPAGIILSGGGASLTTIQDQARASLQLPAKIATLDVTQNNKVRDSVWAIAYGLCVWGMTGTDEESGIKAARVAKSKILNWLKQFLP